MTNNDTPQKKNADGRYEGTNYRYSDKFIKKMTAWLIALIFIGPIIGAGLAIAGDSIFGAGDSPDWYTIICISFVASGIALPLLISGWLGGAALNKYAGPVGLVFVLGIGAVSAKNYLPNPDAWFWGGIAAIVVTGLLFFYIGFQAKVPMWLQLPILNSPRVYISKNKKRPGETDYKKK